MKIDTDEDQEWEYNNFENELAWCIKQLELRISGDVKSEDNIEKAEDAANVLKVLRSSTASMFQKLCAIKATFGDYRTQMAAAERNRAIAWNKPSTTALPSHHLSVAFKVLKRTIKRSKAQTSNAMQGETSVSCDFTKADRCVADGDEATAMNLAERKSVDESWTEDRFVFNFVDCEVTSADNKLDDSKLAENKLERKIF